MSTRNSESYHLVVAAIDYLRTHQDAQPSLGELAKALGVSESTLQRRFSEWAGVSPKRFLQILTLNRARAALARQASVMDATLEAGLSGPARLHDLTVTCDAMTPGEISSGGDGLSLKHGWAASPFSKAFIAWSDRGIVELAFHDEVDRKVIEAFEEEWPAASHSRDDKAAQKQIDQIFHRELKPGKLHLLLRGTNFQVKVWEALMRVPAGELISYQSLAKQAGNEKASRAVGSAMASNRIAYLIPCHRVIRSGGDWGNYRWGIERKIAIHGWEATHR